MCQEERMSGAISLKETCCYHSMFISSNLCEPLSQFLIREAGEPVKNTIGRRIFDREVKRIRKTVIFLLGVAAVMVMFVFGLGKENPKATIKVTVSHLSKEEQDAASVPEANKKDLRKLEVSVRIDDSKSATDRKIELPYLSTVIKQFDQSRVISTSSFEQNNVGSEPFAISEQSVIFDARGLDKEAIRRMFETSYAVVSWTSKDNAKTYDRFSIGNLLHVQQEP